MAVSDEGLETVVNEVYGVEPDEFVAERERHAARARERGEKDLAEKIRKLRKPTKAAALVNRLTRHYADEVEALVELGGRLREAHRQLAGARLRELTHERNERVGALVERACSLVEGHVGESVRQEVAATLRAAVADEAAAEAVTGGRLVTALSPPDVFESMPLPAEAPRPSVRRERSGRTGTSQAEDRPVPSGGESEVPRRADDRVEAERRRRDAEVRARRSRDEARRELRAAEREETRARRRTEAARAALEAAEREVRRYAR